MTISRFAFGWVGGIIMALFNCLACIGWSVVNVIIGGQLINALSSGRVPNWAGILILAILTTLVSVYGYRYVHRYERWAWIPMAVIFAIMFFVAAPHFSIAVSSNTTTAAEIAGLLSFGGAVFGFAIGWSSYAADYNVNQPENTPSSRVFWLTFLGVFIPCVLLETLGMAFTTNAPWAKIFANGLVGDLLAAVVNPLGGFGTLILVLLALSVIANNIPNDYSLGLSVQVFGRPFQRVPRYVWTLIGAVIYVAIAIPEAANFANTLTSFLLIIAYWLGPWSIILIIEHFVFRHGRYNVDDWNNPKGLPIGWAAIVSMAIGLIGAYLGFAQTLIIGKNLIPIPGVNETLLFCGPSSCGWAVTGLVGGLVNPPGGMNVGFELGIVLAAISYLILRRIEINTSEKSRLGTASD
jgi:NCS1 nucleoside transporter family